MKPASPIVFLVDDDLAVREGLSSLIRSVGLHVEAFASAQDFLQFRPPDAPACLVLDVRMPGLSGLDLQRKLADAGNRVPIIFITAHGDIPMTVRAMKAGAVEFLTKPFRNQDLLDAIAHSLKQDEVARLQRAEVAEIQARYETLTSRERDVIVPDRPGHAQQAGRRRTRHHGDHDQGPSPQHHAEDEGPIAAGIGTDG
jgi:FixJ family two-component response regulator